MNEQVLLQVEFSKGSERKLVWVDSHWGLKAGDRVSFYDDYKRKVEDGDEMPVWKVERVYSTRLLVSQIYKRWGLDLPKSQRTER